MNRLSIICDLGAFPGNISKRLKIMSPGSKVYSLGKEMKNDTWKCRDTSEKIILMTFKLGVEYYLPDICGMSGKFGLVVIDIASKISSEIAESTEASLIFHMTGEALRSIKIRGSIIVKLFAKRKESVEIVSSFVDCFDNTFVVKPATSRRSSTECFAVFRGKKDNSGVRWIPPLGDTSS